MKSGRGHQHWISIFFCVGYTISTVLYRNTPVERFSATFQIILLLSSPRVTNSQIPHEGFIDSSSTHRLPPASHFTTISYWTFGDWFESLGFWSMLFYIIKLTQTLHSTEVRDTFFIKHSRIYPVLKTTDFKIEPFVVWIVYTGETQNDLCLRRIARSTKGRLKKGQWNCRQKKNKFPWQTMRAWKFSR